MVRVTIYGRTGCHLCQDALTILDSMKQELEFEVEEILIEGNPELEQLYGEQIPVIHINGVHHDYGRVVPERFRSSLEIHRQHQ